MWRTTVVGVVALIPIAISIHVPRVEDDAIVIPLIGSIFKFQSTSPVWRTTSDEWGIYERVFISIHVPRV